MEEVEAERDLTGADGDQASDEKMQRKSRMYDDHKGKKTIRMPACDSIKASSYYGACVIIFISPINGAFVA